MKEKNFEKISRSEWMDIKVRMALLERIFDVTPDMVFIKDVNGVYLYVSPAFAIMAGFNSAEEIIGHNDSEVFDPIYAKRFVAIDKLLLDTLQDRENYKERLPDDENGRERYCMTSKYVLKSDSGKAIGIYGICRDYTTQFMNQIYHQREVEYFFNMPEDAYYATYVDIDDMRTIDEKRQEVGGVLLPFVHESRSVSEFITDGDEAKRFYGELSYESIHDIFARGQRSIEIEYLRNLPNGVDKWVRTEIRLVQDPTNSHICAMFLVRDIEAQKEHESKLIYAAERDAMTGLLNRAATLNRIKRYIGGASVCNCSLFMIDIDNFKKLNDTHGHQEGDNFIIAFAKCLSGSFRDGDIIGRIGGDEFFVLLDGITDRKVLEARAKYIINEVNSLCAIYEDLQVSVSIGCSVYSEGKDFEKLYGEADAALYEAKSRGKSQFVLAE
ncbi:MAG: GGDEF domain-containing protein [Clostridia bacterium]|nr:GGDEF domain-containing protein [Clostridia bacterium]